jgi:hypothetical protein
MRSRVRESGWSEPAGASGLGRVGSTDAPRAAAISEFSTFTRRAARSSSTDLLASLMSLPHDRAFLLREGGHPLHHLGQGAVGADDARLEGFELGAGGDGGGFLGGGGDELGELLLHRLICASAGKVGKRKHPEDEEAPEGRGFVRRTSRSS